MNVILKALLSSLIEKKARTFLVLFSIAVSASLIFANESFARTVTQRFYEADVRWGGNSDLYIETKKAAGAKEWIDPAKLEPYQASFAYAFQMIREKALYMPSLEQMHYFTILGADINEFNRHNPLTLSQGDFKDWTGNNIIIGKTYASLYHWKVGDVVRLELNNAPYDFKIIGISEVKGLFLRQLADHTVEVLKNINLRVDKGEFISIMGPSGSGKSTLLYLMGGLDQVTQGTICVNGIEMQKLNDDAESRMRRNDIGFVFQAYNLIDNLTLEENIMLPALLEGKNKKVVMQQAEELMDRVGILSRRNHTPKELSGGEQQRTAIARALINQPYVLFADEPIGNLDSKSGKEVLGLLRDINKEKGITILMVTHSEESTRYGNRIIRLRDGEIVV